MTTWAGLDPAKKEAYNNFLALLRPMIGKIENVNLTIEYMVTLWTAEIQAIHNEINNGEVIPDATGYPNSTDLPKADIGAMLQFLQAVFSLRTAETQALAVKAVGPENIIAGLE